MPDLGKDKNRLNKKLVLSGGLARDRSTTNDQKYDHWGYRLTRRLAGLIAVNKQRALSL